MSRHRNIRTLEYDDLATYDEALASSVDDDYAISPTTADRYLYNRDKRAAHEIFTFPNNGECPLSFSVDDFPENEETVKESIDDSPCDVTGRIVSKKSDSNLRTATTTKRNPTADSESKDLLFGDLNEASFTALGHQKNAPNSFTVQELDFGDFEALALAQDSSKTAGHSSGGKIRTQIPSTVFSSSQKEFLKKGVSLFPGNKLFIPQSRLSENVLQIKKQHPMPCVSGGKNASNLGRVISEDARLRSLKKVETVISRLSYALARSRFPSLNILLSHGDVSGFTFNSPEPVTFERHPDVKPRRLPVLPPPRHRKCNAATPQAKPTEIPTTTTTTNDLGGELKAAAGNVNVNTPIKDVVSTLSKISLGPSVVASPSKPIDRHCLVNEYAKMCNDKNEKEIINLIVVGHVDAGKSTLMGNMLCKLGHVSGKQLAKYQWEAQKIGKSSFAYAWVLDQTTEERHRGVTMDIAQTSFETKSKRVALMDAPGHKDFVPRVIGGACQADAALLVINATRGEFETGFGTGGQTREHTRLARLLGVGRLIVAVNKMDTIDWDETRFEEIKTRLQSFLKSMSFPAVQYCPVSGLLGINLTSNPSSDSDKDKNPMPWYTGPCLLDMIDSIPPPDRYIDSPFRFVVSDIFKPAGSSVAVVAGRVLSGAVSAGVNVPTSKVVCQPSDARTSIKSIRSLCNTRADSGDVKGGDMGGRLLDQIVKYAFAGDQVAFMLADIDPFQSLAPGDLLSDPDNPVPLAYRIKAKLLVFAIEQPITKGYPVIFYYHCSSIPATISRLHSMTHKQNKIESTVQKPRCLMGNCTADVEISFERAICLETYDKCKPLGRFMLRVGGESIAGGTVTSVLPQKKNRLDNL